MQKSDNLIFGNEIIRENEFGKVSGNQIKQPQSQLFEVFKFSKIFPHFGRLVCH